MSEEKKKEGGSWERTKKEQVNTALSHEWRRTNRQNFYMSYERKPPFEFMINCKTVEFATMLASIKFNKVPSTLYCTCDILWSTIPGSGLLFLKHAHLFTKLFVSLFMKPRVYLHKILPTTENCWETSQWRNMELLEGSKVTQKGKMKGERTFSENYNRIM